jgi:hypothetical protein
VTPAGDRILGRSGEAQEHVPTGRLARQLLGTVDLEGVGAIVEERHVIDAEGLGDGGIVLMAGAADRVEAFAPRLQPAREPVHLPAYALAVEQFHHGFTGEADVARLHTAGAPWEIFLATRATNF